MWASQWLIGKEFACSAGDVGDTGSILSQEDPLEEGMATPSSILAWRIPWTEAPGGLQFIEQQRVGHDRSNWAHMRVIKPLSLLTLKITILCVSGIQRGQLIYSESPSLRSLGIYLFMPIEPLVAGNLVVHAHSILCQSLLLHLPPFIGYSYLFTCLVLCKLNFDRSQSLSFYLSLACSSYDLPQSKHG